MLPLVTRLLSTPQSDGRLYSKDWTGKTYDLAEGGVASAIIQAYIDGFEVDCDGTDVTLQPGVARDDGNNFTLLAENALTIDPTQTGANGLDTGSLVANTFYYAWVIAKLDGTTSGLLSTSATNPTMPSGYIKKRRVGTVLTDGTGDLYGQFTKRGGGNRRGVWYAVASGNNASPLMLVMNKENLSYQTWTDVDCSSFIGVCLTNVQRAANLFHLIPKRASN